VGIVVGGGISTEPPELRRRNYLTEEEERERRQRWLKYVAKMKEMYGDHVFIDSEGKVSPIYVPESKRRPKQKEARRNGGRVDLNSLEVGKTVKTPNGIRITKLQSTIVRFEYPNGVIKTVSEYPDRTVVEKLFPEGVNPKGVTKVVETKFKDDCVDKDPAPSKIQKTGEGFGKKLWCDFLAYNVQISLKTLGIVVSNGVSRKYYSIAEKRCFNHNYERIENVVDTQKPRWDRHLRENVYPLKEPYLSNLAAHLAGLNQVKRLEDIIENALPMLVAYADFFDE
jgi:hypothetical protein